MASRSNRTTFFSSKKRSNEGKKFLCGISSWMSILLLLYEGPIEIMFLGVFAACQSCGFYESLKPPMANKQIKSAPGTRLGTCCLIIQYSWREFNEKTERLFLLTSLNSSLKQPRIAFPGCGETQVPSPGEATTCCAVVWCRWRGEGWRNVLSHLFLAKGGRVKLWDSGRGVVTSVGLGCHLPALRGRMRKGGRAVFSHSRAVMEVYT